MTGGPLAVVTGASGGIGAACTRALQDRGFIVLGVDRELHSVANEHIVVDLRSVDCGEEVREAVAGRPLRALINNAAMAAYETAENTSLKTWDDVIATNLRSVFLISRAVLQSLRLAAGSVVNLASVHALATSPGVAAYAASKGGVLALTRALALEWASYDIRVNALLPGAIDTPMLAAGISRSVKEPNELADRHPLKRLGTPSDVASAALFLLSSEAAFITGAAFVVDGGALAKLSTE